ncbi:AbiTii domain-containing protein [Kosakonia oryzae]|uniref:AbiTii domain-containing protein n=1 Tax=Kosakonia oryzae TaxID=497725 RepID=UPI001D08F853|nr:hypothetical protein [Kosakonia oryzae]UDJ80555.1 hypothetical protein I5186_15200 [Kosakonia oryzae]
MVKVEDIVNDLTSGTSRITDALLKTKVLLFAIDKKYLALWVDHELKGYPDTVELPEYRIATARVLINANNLVHHYNGLELNLTHFDDEEYNRARQSFIRISISQIEHLLSESQGEHFFSESIPVAMARYYAPEVHADYHITKIYKQIALHHLTSIITQVRTRLIDFMLELSSQLDSTEGETLSDKAKKIDINSMFANAVFGPNAVINVGDRNSTNVTIVIEKNNFNMLEKHLSENGVEQKDIDDLGIALREDEKISKRHSNSYGPQVAQWFTKMISKASDNTWTVGVNVASTLLTTALNQYLGISS